jgi:tRNA-dihydrouridine synthase C
MKYLPKDSNGCPFLLLAPMEGVGDRCFRKAMASVGGFDEAVSEFLRVPTNAHVKSLAKEYQADELGTIPLPAQIMGSDPDLMAEMAHELQERGAPRIDLNCGCPSNTVTGRGAGSSLLKDPELLHKIAHAMVKAVDVPVTVKMRSGFEDTSLFTDNLLAAQESGIKFLTLHPRTKVEGYGPPAHWDLIAKAKTILKIPIVGNGDILNVQDALRMLAETHCDALMVGRGSVINPFIFHQIRAHFSGKLYIPDWNKLVQFIDVYIAATPPSMPLKTKLGKMKQLMSFLFKGNAELQKRKQEMLTSTISDLEGFLNFALPLLKEGWGQS